MRSTYGMSRAQGIAGRGVPFASFATPPLEGAVGEASCAAWLDFFGYKKRVQTFIPLKSPQQQTKNVMSNTACGVRR